jgi:hypothetical protein
VFCVLTSLEASTNFASSWSPYGSLANELAEISTDLAKLGITDKINKGIISESSLQ